MLQKIAILVTLVSASALVQAKLPAPPPLSPEAALKAEEAKQRAAYNTKREAYQLCMAMDKASAHYFKTVGAGKQPSANVPNCTDPGVFAFTPPRPLESSESHSPAGTATKPPSTNTAGPEKPTPAKP
jgi:hypothetical protein